VTRGEDWHPVTAPRALFQNPNPPRPAGLAPRYRPAPRTCLPITAPRTSLPVTAPPRGFATINVPYAETDNKLLISQISMLSANKDAQQDQLA